jgi:uncharacterized protein (TIGR03437 family)
MRKASGAAIAICGLILASPVRSQTITTFAGNGVAGFSGDGGPASSAALNHPKGMAIDPAGNVYIADPDNARIRVVNSSGAISTFAGNGLSTFGGDGGPAASASISDVMGVALDAAGNLYVADSSNRRIRKIANGAISTIAGVGVEGFSGDGGPAANAMLGRPVALATDAAGNLYYVDSTQQRIRKIATNGIITTIAGNGLNGFAGDNGPALSASMSFPLGIAVDRSLNIYIADAGNNRVRKITPAGTIVTVAGSGAEGFSGDGGPAVNAQLNLPSDVAVDNAGNFYIADSGNNRVRKVDGSGTITTIAGVDTNGFSGDGGPPASAMLNYPWGLAVDSAGAIYIADRVNTRVREISSAASSGGPPAVNAVVNGASFAANSPVAPGSLVAIFGTGLAAGTAPASVVPLPLSLGQTGVTFNGVSAPLFFVSAGQINAQVPFTVAAGTASVQVTRSGASSAPANIGITPYSPGIFAMDQAGGAAVFHADFTQVTTAAPAHAGETVVLYATGLGPLVGAVTSGAAASAMSTTSTPVVTVGNARATVAYAGLARGLVGVYQVNFMVPGGLSPGNQPIQLTIGGAASNTANMAVTP